MLATSNEVCNTPLDALRDALRGYCMSVEVRQSLYSPKHIEVRVGRYFCKVTHEVLHKAVEIHWPFGKKLSDLELGLMMLAGRGQRPAHPRWIIGDRGRWVPDKILAEARRCQSERELDCA